ncbi:hypothetical protein HPB49_003378 [Dermacentor silvarum]|uniref:Uncharacterized protein n=1 Tax=Dermacentor silvarum TaxID=543639 RepID=A0ACB8D261_DERSI|nr:hypothetical protein HPB49_003378 [Dermacentor silvarum]
MVSTVAAEYSAAAQSRMTTRSPTPRYDRRAQRTPSRSPMYRHDSRHAPTEYTRENDNIRFIDEQPRFRPPPVSPAQTPHLDELQPEMRRTVNDHANTSWGVAVVGSAVILFATGVFCTSGLFYVYFVDTFCVSREAASWPASVMGVTLTCSGLVVSLLQCFLSIFQISLLGSILLWTSLMLSAFAPNMQVMTALLGALHVPTTFKSFEEENQCYHLFGELFTVTPEDCDSTVQLELIHLQCLPHLNSLHREQRHLRF